MRKLSLRPWRAAVVTVLACVLAAPGTASASHTADHTLPAFGIGHIKTEWLAGDPAGLADFGLMRTTGVRMYRARFRQDRVLAGGSYSNWVQLDGLVKQAALNGVLMQPILINMPGEVYTPPKTKQARMAFGDFAAAAVKRYGPSGTFWRTCGCPPQPIRAWEVWNEANITPFWDVPNATEYGELLKETRAKIRRADPRARIVFGGLAYPSTVSATKLDADAFLRQTIAAVGSNQFDALAVHPYQRDAAAALAKVAATVQTLKTYGGTESTGRPRHQLWVNEYGRYIVPDDPATVTDELAVSEQRQLEWLVTVTDSLLSHRSDWNVGHLNWYMMRDYSGASSNWHRYGLRRTNTDESDGGARPAWDAYAKRVAAAPMLDLPTVR